MYGRSFKPGFHIVDGVATVARVAEKKCLATTRIFWKGNSATDTEHSDPTELSDPCDSKERKLNFNYHQRSQALPSPERKTLVGSDHVAPAFLVLKTKVNVGDVLKIDS